MWANIKYWLKHHDYAWKYKLEVILPLFVFLVACDWATKIAVQFTMNQGQELNPMPGFMSIQYIINPGSAYGANAGSVGGSIAIAAVITLITAVIIAFLNDKMWLIAIVFIFAGSFANLIARAWSPAVTYSPNDESLIGVKGGVIDFMMWGFSAFGANTYIFNVADLWVNLGVILLVVFIIVEIVKFIISTQKKNKEAIDAPRDLNDPDTFGTSQPRVDEVREEQDEPVKLTSKELKARAKLEKKIRNNETDRKATKYEKQRDQKVADDIQNRKLTAKEIKAQKKLEKMSKNERKSK